MPRDASHPAGGVHAVNEPERKRPDEPTARSSASAVACSLARAERGAERDTLIEGLARASERAGDSPRSGVLLRTDRRGCGQLFALSGRLRLGRAWEAEARIEDDSISRLHAQIDSEQGKFIITDLGSGNGTFVNGERIISAELRDGSVVQLGSRVTFRFSVVQEDEQRALSSLQNLGQHDPLTGVYNRRHLERHLAAELAFAERHDSSISVILIDLDHFKRVNDEHGHLAGDLVLERVAELVASQIRTEDMLARYGGEEFIIVLRETPLAGAEILAERIRRVVAGAAIAVSPAQALAVTLSAGCASLACTAGADVEQLIQTADRRLYLAKQQGRNCVMGAAPRLRSIPPPPASSPEPLVATSEVAPASQVYRLDRLAHAFAALPQQLQLVVGLRCQESCTFAEIAAILSCSEQQVLELYQQANALMRQSAA
jgi:two-component system, cell cycle response regulator